MTPGLLALALLPGPQATPPPCRIAAIEFTTTTEAPNLTAESTSTCGFDRKALIWTCTAKYKDNMGTSTTSVSVTTYRSIADLVDEIAVIPPVLRSLRVDTTTDGTRGAAKSSVVYTYDAQRRLKTEVATTRGSRAMATTTYTNWDAQGRPTTGKMTASGSPASTLTLSYDDAARTQTITSEARGQQVTCEMGFDANGNSISHACRGSGGLISSAKTTIGKTDRICR